MRIGITMGDASGVGPELLLQACERNELKTPFIAFGDMAALTFARKKLGLSIPLRAISIDDEAPDGELCVVDAGLLTEEDIRPGEISKASGYAAVRYVEAAIRAAQAGQIDAIVTLPINKEASALSFPGFQGHTELLAERCGVTDYVMMLTAPDVIATHVSTHVSLREAIERTKTERILTVIRMTHEAVSRIRPRARIAVAGLNPHAGEHGAFGREEIEEIMPAIEAARSEGIDVSGPIPPDTVFMQAINGAYEAVVCMYHDQGHIALKTHGFDKGVNVTVGLPIIRTSVDHGTAFDIAYQGKASTINLVNAFDLAVQMAQHR
jgi:4-hydroxythreonine-4-phosphate dehydrogenase